jgi:putative RecB family exonuclease
VQLSDDGEWAEVRSEALNDDDGGPLPRHLSPSSAGTYTQCARRWRFRYIEHLPDPPGEAALAGTFAHRVLELLFQLPPAQRTIDDARRLARDVWPDTEAHPDFQALDLDDNAARLFRWRGWRAIEGLWELEDPAGVQVEATEQQMVTSLGDVPFRGIVDRLDRRPDGSLEVTDYKSGRAPSPRFRSDRLAQVRLYAAAVEQATDDRPRRARLLYLGQRVVDIEVTDAALQPVVDALHGTWASLQRACATDDFAPSPGALCAWCPYADRCAEGTAEVRRRHELGVLTDAAPALQLLARAG